MADKKKVEESLSKEIDKKDIDKIVKAFIEHYIDIEYFSNEVKNRLWDILMEYEDELYDIIDTYDFYNTKRQFNEISEYIKEATKDITDVVSDEFKKIADDIIGIESAFLLAQYGFEAPKNLTVNRVVFPTFNRKETLNTFAENLKTKVTNTFTNGLKTGAIFGQSKEQVKEIVQKNMKSVENGFKSDVETIPTSFSRTVDQIIYNSNSKDITGYVWASVLDGNTCLVCCDYSGREFDSDILFEMPPLHNRCRCYLQPIVKNNVPDIPTYEEYLESISEEEKLKQMGKGRYEIYKQYPEVIKDFVNNGTKITLEELRKKY